MSFFLQATRDAQRRAALEKARVARSKAAAVRAEHLAVIGLHFCPADDHYTKTCRTLCEKIVPTVAAYAPRASAGILSAPPAGLCLDCAMILSSWRGTSKKPLTLRRLRMFLPRGPVTISAAVEISKDEQPTSPRLRALVKARLTRVAETVEETGREDFEDPIVGLLEEIAMIELRVVDGCPRDVDAANLRHLTLMLINLAPSQRVVTALQR